MANEALNLEPAEAPAAPAAQPAWRQWLFAGVLPLLVLAAGLTGSYMLLETAPQAKRAAARPAQARLVEVQAVTAGVHPTRVQTVGTVVAARESTLYPEVAGRIVEISPRLLPGGRFEKGETLLRIEDADYRLALRQQQSAVAQAEAALQQEKGQQANARAEYAMSNRKLPPEQEALVLRRPQLAAAKAELQSAQAALDRARLDLDRTRVTAPFAGMVLSRSVDLGTRVTTAMPLLKLVDTGEFWLQASVPVDQLRWIAIPGAPVRVRNDAAWDAAVYRRGEVLSLTPDLDSQGRMARLLIHIPDPLALQPEHRGLPKVLLNDFLQVEIEGRPLNDVVALNRGLLRDGDRVWLLNDKGRLEIRPVHVAFKSAGTALIDRGLAPGERVVLTDLAAPVPGMALRTRDDDAVAQRSESRP